MGSPHRMRESNTKEAPIVNARTRFTDAIVTLTTYPRNKKKVLNLKKIVYAVTGISAYRCGLCCISRRKIYKRLHAEGDTQYRFKTKQTLAFCDESLFGGGLVLHRLERILTVLNRLPYTTTVIFW